MFERLLWRVAGLMLLLVLSGSVGVLVYTVLIPLVHTAIMPMTHPLMGPICPGNPECG